MSISTSSSLSTTPSSAAARPRGSGVVLLALAGVAWGTGGLLGSLLGREAGLSPLAVAGYRLGLGGLLVGVWLLSAAAAGRRTWPRLGAAGHRRAAAVRVATVAVLTAAFQGCYFTAVALSGVGLATLVAIGTAPVVVTAVEAVRGRARRGSAGTVALALIGLGLLVGLPAATPDALAAVLGAAAAAAAGTGFAALTLVGARPVPGLDPATTTAASFVLGGLLLAVPAAVVGGPALPTTPAGYVLVALFALVPTALAYTAYFAGLRTVATPATATVLALLEPLTAAVLAAVVLGERLGVVGTVGALVLAVAVVRATGIFRGRRRRSIQDQRRRRRRPWRGRRAST